MCYDTRHGACWFIINDPDVRVFDRYSFVHAKYALVDRQKVLITSQNLTARGLPDEDRSNGTYGSRGVVLLTVASSTFTFASFLNVTEPCDVCYRL